MVYMHVHLNCSVCLSIECVQQSQNIAPNLNKLNDSEYVGKIQDYTHTAALHKAS